MYIDKDTSNGCNLNESLLRRMSCGCEGNTVDTTQGTSACNGKWGLKDYPLAMVYSPLQEFCELYDLDDALKNGTLFKQLDLPFMGESVVRGGGCRG
ncbi:MAG: spore coat associated protein CotJA [Ruminococcaceae bacterium]|nr:spore coat associated protein CotJA [Oscillospiraceae bacterium]